MIILLIACESGGDFIPFLDLMNFITVFGGGILLSLAKKGRLSLVSKMRKGVVYLGWFIGIIFILNSFNFSEKAVLPELGLLLALAMLSLLYGYLGRTICRFFEK